LKDKPHQNLEPKTFIRLTVFKVVEVDHQTAKRFCITSEWNRPSCAAKLYR